MYFNIKNWKQPVFFPHFVVGNDDYESLTITHKVN